MSRGLTLQSGTSAMLTTMMGSGVINMPLAIAEIGYINGLIIVPIVSFLSFFTLYAISYAAFKYNKTNEEHKLTFYTVVNEYSSALAAFVDVCLVLQGVGACVSYLKVLIMWIPMLFEQKPGGWFVFLSIPLIIPLYFLALQKNLSALKNLSLVTVSAVCYLAFLLGFFAILFMNVSAKDLGIMPLKAFNNKYYKALSYIIFALGCHQNIVQVFSEMEVQSIKQITLVSLFAILAGGSLYLFIGMAGYMIVGSGIRQAILSELLGKESKIRIYIETQTFDKHMLLVKLGVVSFLCVLFGAFPFQMHPARDSTLSLLARIGYIRRIIDDESGQKKMKFIITTVYCLFVLAIALFDNIKYEFVTGLIGATATTAVTYIIPPAVYMLCVRKLTVNSLFSGMVMTFGLVLMGYLLYNQLTAKE